MGMGEEDKMGKMGGQGGRRGRDGDNFKDRPPAKRLRIPSVSKMG